MWHLANSRTESGQSESHFGPAVRKSGDSLKSLEGPIICSMISIVPRTVVAGNQYEPWPLVFH